MALLNCPECDKEISDRAVACPHCGYPLSKEQSEIDTNTNDATKVEGSDVKPLSTRAKLSVITGMATFIVIIIGVVIYALFSNSKSNSVYFYHSALGAKISIGMEKEKIDKILGNPSLQYEEYVYTGNLHVVYNNGIATALGVFYPNSTWSVIDGIKIDSTRDEIISKYGNPLYIDDECYTYAFDSKGKVSSRNNAVC